MVLPGAALDGMASTSTQCASPTSCATSPREVVADLIEQRRSIRRFLDKPVKPDVLGGLLRAARRAPSGGNLQPGHFIQVTGGTRARLSAALSAAYRDGRAETEDYTYFPTPMSPTLKRRQVLAAKALYDTLGIAREDRAARTAYFDRNFHFFDAPLALIVTIDGRLGSGCYMDLGMSLYGLMLAAVADGLGSCAIGALASYPQLVRQELGLLPDRHIVCGLAIGWPDETAPENNFRTDRLPLEDYVSILDQPP
jgi:nitroreductase